MRCWLLTAAHGVAVYEMSYAWPSTALTNMTSLRNYYYFLSQELEVLSKSHTHQKSLLLTQLGVRLRDLVFKSRNLTLGWTIVTFSPFSCLLSFDKYNSEEYDIKHEKKENRKKVISQPYLLSFEAITSGFRAHFIAPVFLKWLYTLFYFQY